MSNADKVKNVRSLKEAEFRDDVKKKRQRFMLEQARKMLNRDGFQALNLPELAKLSGYSKPTIYKYFPSKEDLMVALAAESSGKQIAYLERATTFDGRPREKIHGIYSLNIGPLREAVHDALLIYTDRIRSKATPERQRILYRNEEKRFQIISAVVREAKDNGDLKLPVGVEEYQLVFALMSTSLGGYVIQASDSPAADKWFKKYNFSHGDFGRIILDGIGWRPLSSEWDYLRAVQRFYREVFPELLSDEKQALKGIV